MDVWLTNLEDQLQASLRPIQHRSYNRTYTGFSHRFDQGVFVKVFTPPRRSKFSTERLVNLQTDQRVLTSWIEPDGRAVLVMTDLKMKPVTTLTPGVAGLMGSVLRQFHEQVRLPAETAPAALDFDKTQRSIQDLTANPEGFDLVALMHTFKTYQAEITGDLRRQPVVSLHGDVGLRNFCLVNGQIELIDFERCRSGYWLEDVQKFFYQDLQQRPELLKAFCAGYGPVAPLSLLTTNWLRFQCGVGLLTYVQHFSDPAFAAVGLAMLTTVKTAVVPGNYF